MSGRAFVDRYVFDLDGVANINAIRCLMTEMVRELGLRHFVYHGMNLPIPGHRDNYLLLSYPLDWIDRYTSNDYFRFDPVVGRSQAAVVPFDWKVVDKSASGAKRVFGEAGEFGIGSQGLSCPVRGPRNDRALFTVTADVGDAEWDLLKHEHLGNFVLLGQFLHQKVIELEGVRSVEDQPSLSRRELECLKWAASGKTNADIAVILGLAESTVRFYLDLARHKLNCLNRPHAVARAIRLGLIDGDF